MGQQGSAKLISDLRDKAGPGANLLDGGDEDTDTQILKLIKANEKSIQRLKLKISRLEEDVENASGSQLLTKIDNGVLKIKDTATGEWLESGATLTATSLNKDSLTKEEKAQVEKDDNKQGFYSNTSIDRMA